MVAGLTGFEPATFRVTGGCSIQSELQPQFNIAKLILSLLSYLGQLLSLSYLRCYNFCMPKINTKNNKEIAQMLHEISAAYEARGDNRFKIIAYNRAADSIEHTSEELKDVWEEGKLDDLPGIGASLAQHLDEYFTTVKVKHFDQVKKGLPKGMFEILKVPGVGPKSAYKLAKKLNIT